MQVSLIATHLVVMVREHCSAVTGHQQAAAVTVHVVLCSCLQYAVTLDVVIFSYKHIACEDAALSSGVFIATTSSLVALWVATMTIFGIVTAVLCWRNHKLKQNGSQTIM